MTIFRSRALDGLDTIYRFPGGRGAPEEVDVSAPVQLVHDVSRTAELTTGITYVYELSEITGGAGVVTFGSVDKLNLITSVNSISARAANLGLTPTNTDVWLLDVAAAITNASQANIGNVSLAIYPPDDSPAATELYGALVGFWNSVLNVAFESGGSWRPLYDSATPPGQALTGGGLKSRLPRRVGSLRARFLDGGAGAASYSLRFLVAILPKGVRPITG